MHQQLWGEVFHQVNSWRATLNAETRWPVHHAAHDQGMNQMVVVWNPAEHPGKKKKTIIIYYNQNTDNKYMEATAMKAERRQLNFLT